MRIAYEASPRCADRRAFLEGVRSRTEHAELDDTDTLAWPLEVSIREVPSPNGVRFMGQVAFDDPDGRHALRRVDGSNCEQVVSSVALVVALAIDDRVAWLAARSDAAAPLPSPPSAAPSEPPKKEAAPALAPRERVVPPESRPVAPVAGTLSWAVGGSVGALSWLGPNPARGLGLFAELGSSTGSATLRVSWIDARQSPTQYGVPSHFAADFARIEGCPIALVRSSGLSLSPCVGLDAGLLRASVEPTAQLTNATGKTIFWGALAAAVRLRFRPVERLLLDLDGELALPLVRHHFQLEDPQRELFDVPAVGVGTKVGVGLLFP